MENAHSIEEKAVENEAFVRGFYDIPHETQLKQMSFTDLVMLMTSCKKDTPKFFVVEREHKKRLAHDQAKSNRRNVLLGAGIGGVFGLAGVFLGAHLKK